MGGGRKGSMDGFGEDLPVDVVFDEAVERQDRVDKGFGPKGRITRGRIRKKMPYQGVLTKIARAIHEKGIAPGAIVRVTRLGNHCGHMVVVVTINAKELLARPLDPALGATFTVTSPGNYNASADVVGLACEFVHAAAPGFAPAAFFIPMNHRWGVGGAEEWLQGVGAGLNPQDRYIDSNHPEYGHFWRIAAVEARLAELEQLKAATKKRA